MIYIRNLGGVNTPIKASNGILITIRETEYIIKENYNAGITVRKHCGNDSSNIVISPTAVNEVKII